MTTSPGKRYLTIFGWGRTSKKYTSLLYLFIGRYGRSEIKEFAAFAKGLGNDFAVVENSVASPFSNGFVEGTNSKLKMVKRSKYGR